MTEMLPLGRPFTDEGDRESLLAEYRHLVLSMLPARARREGWVVTADHCFGRIILDNAVGGDWRAILTDWRRPGFRQLSVVQLRKAVALSREVERLGEPHLRMLNANSLRLRNMEKRNRGSGSAEGDRAWT